MEKLTMRERELVALGAALGSNCVPCIEFHIPEARKAGLSEGQIGEAVRLADKVRQVPAAKVLKVALEMLTAEPAPESSGCAEKETPKSDSAQPCCV